MIATFARALSLGLLLAVVAVSSAQARRHQERITGYSPAIDRHAPGGWAAPSFDRPTHQVRKVRTAGFKQMRRRWQRQRDERKPQQRTARVVRSTAAAEATLLPHPVGCPTRAFCGCGAAIEVFGRPIRELWLAANWLHFPPAQPAPGMVAVRRHHVFVLRRHVDGDRWLAFDANSGGRRTRLHVRSVAGYSIRNPHGSRRYASAG